MVVAGCEHVTAEFVRTGEWSVDLAGRRIAAQASLRPLYDPKAERIHA